LTDPQYHLEIESDPKNLITVEEFINYFSKDLNIDEEKMSGLMLAITEATTNAIIHANKNDPNKLVQIDVRVDGENLVISIKDEGKGFDPEKVPDPTEPENLMKDSGRGLYLMRVYMDDLKYNFTPTGMETILTVKIH
jgi:serine/threonine-protein kinase RsbW